MYQLRPARGGRAAPFTPALVRGRGKRRADRTLYPAVDVPMAEIAAERHFIEAILTNCGVPSDDISDVLQDVYCGAYRSLRARRYRPPPDLEPREALTRWLAGIAWHRALKYRDSAQRRLVPSGLRFVIEGPLLINQILARETLGILYTLRSSYRDALICVAEGLKLQEIAARMKIPRTTAALWIWRGRLALKAVIARRHRR